ncbi:MAG: NeuD/PglB/VioB family sugar acetyltransferase [Deltaproteobacteria bacterium]|nr:NeuD/PglB/VioB family sugar acetyltransferase [Deltaproteobacteria bacterium]
MNDIIILGAGGLGLEIAWLIEEINEEKKTWNLIGFMDPHPGVQGKNFLDYPVLGGYSLIEKFQDAHYVIAFGDPRLRETVIEQNKTKINKWANLYSPTVRVHKSHRIGTGVVIGRYTDLTVGCRLGNFAMLNIHVVLGHNVIIGDYSIISPNVTINGGAKIGSVCSVGANAFVRDVTIGDYVSVGASSCVVKDVESDCVVAGVPARVIHKGKPFHSVTVSER